MTSSNLSEQLYVRWVGDGVIHPFNYYSTWVWLIGGEVAVQCNISHETYIFSETRRITAYISASSSTLEELPTCLKMTAYLSLLRQCRHVCVISRC